MRPCGSYLRLWLNMFGSANTSPRQHAFSDLCLYACTHDNCSCKYVFESEDDWFRHEIDNHRRQWECHLCTRIFWDSSDFRGHLRASHKGSFTPKRLQILSEACEKGRTSFEETACPLCVRWESAHFKAEELPERFKSHVGSHLRWIALQSLPEFLVGLECDGVGPKVVPTTVGDDQQSTEAQAEGNESLVPAPSDVYDDDNLSKISLGSDSKTDLAIGQRDAPEFSSSSNRPRLPGPRDQIGSVTVSRNVSVVSGSQQMGRAQRSVSHKHGSFSVPAVAGETFWSCSNCGEGPFFLSTTDMCILCSHTRCEHCPFVQ